MDSEVSRQAVRSGIRRVRTPACPDPNREWQAKTFTTTAGAEVRRDHNQSDLDFQALARASPRRSSTTVPNTASSTSRRRSSIHSLAVARHITGVTRIKAFRRTGRGDQGILLCSPARKPLNHARAVMHLKKFSSTRPISARKARSSGCVRFEGAGNHRVRRLHTKRIDTVVLSHQHGQDVTYEEKQRNPFVKSQ
jgi:S-adenosylmethionine synthetase